MKHFLVTGGGGFLGSAIVRRLVANGHRVRVFDDFSRGRPRRLASVATKIDSVWGDIQDAGAVDRAAYGVSDVIHMAYINGTRFFYEKPRQVLEVGIRGMLNVLDACRTQKVDRLFLASSSEVYQTPPVVPTPEEVPLVVPDVQNPRYSYGGGKIASELLTIHSGLPHVVIFRPHNVYGPDMGDEHVIPNLAARVLELAAAQPEGPLRVSILGSGDQVRAFVHIDDFTEALSLVLDRGKNKGVYHLGNPDPIAIRALVMEIGRIVNREIVVVPGEAPLGETSHRIPDIGKVAALGFQPKVSLRQGLEEVVRWFQRK